MSIKPLNSLLPDEVAIINKFKEGNHLQTRFAEMGLIPGLQVRLVKKAPFHGTLEIKIRSFYMSLRWEDASQIMVKINNE